MNNNKYKVLGAIIEGDWIKLYYRKFRGRIVYSCYIYETEFRNDTMPKWFGKIVR